jgi:FeS assembly protein IscX
MMHDLEPPINWTDYEDIATGLYERFGNDFTDTQIARANVGDLAGWILELRNFAGTVEEAEPGHIEMIRNAWIEEWRNNQKPVDSNLK